MKAPTGKTGGLSDEELSDERLSRVERADGGVRDGERPTLLELAIAGITSVPASHR